MTVIRSSYEEGCNTRQTMADPETNIDWSIQIAMIRSRFEDALRAGETLDSLTRWLERVPEHVRPELQAELEACHGQYFTGSLDTRIVSSDAALGPAKDDLFSSGEQNSQSAVRDCSTFNGLSEAARDGLEQKLERKSFAKGDQLLEQGEPARGLHLILDGHVDIIDVAAGERIDCDGAGSVLGEMSLLTNQPCSADVVATSDVEALVLSAQGYSDLKSQHPELEIAISQLVSDRLGGRRRDALCGKVLDHYELIQCINRGGMGVVYEAKDIDTGGHVALKMLRHRFIYDDQMQSRFDLEAQLLEELQHPNVVTLRGNFLAYRTRFLVLDLCDGADLARVLRGRGALDEPTVRALLGQIAAGLQHAHSAGVIHRDVKPANVLVDRNGQTRLTDFGLSKLIESELLEGKAVGTPSYMPPEQFRTSDLGPESDWYSLGCLIYEMLTGEVLFQPKSWIQMFDAKRQTSPSDEWPEVNVSTELRQIIHGSLHPDPRRRRLDLDQLAEWAAPVPGVFGGSQDSA
ncbi:MAG: protein kinase domain-containing protein [Rubripirellula sp.]